MAKLFAIIALMTVLTPVSSSVTKLARDFAILIEVVIGAAGIADH